MESLHVIDTNVCIQQILIHNPSISLLNDLLSFMPLTISSADSLPDQAPKDFAKRFSFGLISDFKDWVNLEIMSNRASGFKVCRNNGEGGISCARLRDAR
jgi:hypothetical protein